jgi:hypothetical protein
LFLLVNCALFFVRGITVDVDDSLLVKLFFNENKDEDFIFSLCIFVFTGAIVTKIFNNDI